MNFEYKCLIKWLFDFECAGCGATRMFKSLLKGEFYQAFRYNPYVFIVLFIFFCYIIYAFFMIILKKKVYIPNIKLLYVFLIATILFMILRNMPGFEFLLPTQV